MRQLLDLKWNQCRWPVHTESEDQHWFCGCTRQKGSSYCPAHHDASLKRNEAKS